jgi:hypothetical protein
MSYEKNGILSRYSSLALLRSYGPLKTYKEVAEPPGNDIEQVEDRMDLDMSQFGKSPLESMKKFESQSNATEQVVGMVHIDRVAACLDRSMWCS